MNAIRLTMFGLILVAAIALRHAVFADQYSITGGGSDSQSTIDVSRSQSTSVNQNNQGSFRNDVDAEANTGGNAGGSVTTGDASVNVTVDNQFNSNQANVPCCPDGKASPTPTPKPHKPGETPTPIQSGPTPPGGVGGPPSGDGDGGGNGGGNGGDGVGGGGEVIGISAAAGENYMEIALTASGIVCLLAGAYLTRKNHLAM